MRWLRGGCATWSDLYGFGELRVGPRCVNATGYGRRIPDILWVFIVAVDSAVETAVTTATAHDQSGMQPSMSQEPQKSRLSPQAHGVCAL
jgi:hypothetical protein